MSESVPNSNERELLNQVAAGSEEAFKILFDTYERRVCSYAFKVTGSAEAAEDITQDVFIEVWNIRARLATIVNFNAYIHKMAYHAAYKSLQQIAKEKLLVRRLKEEAENMDNGMSHERANQLLSMEIRQQIQSLVDQLTPKQRQVFLLSREQGLKQEEIAEKLGIGLSTVKSHMVDALKLLREGLANQYGSQAMVIFVIWQLGNV